MEQSKEKIIERIQAAQKTARGKRIMTYGDITLVRTIISKGTGHFSSRGPVPHVIIDPKEGRTDSLGHAGKVSAQIAELELNSSLVSIGNSHTEQLCQKFRINFAGIFRKNYEPLKIGYHFCKYAGTISLLLQEDEPQTPISSGDLSLLEQKIELSEETDSFCIYTTQNSPYISSSIIKLLLHKCIINETPFFARLPVPILKTLLEKCATELAPEQTTIFMHHNEAINLLALIEAKTEGCYANLNTEEIAERIKQYGKNRCSILIMRGPDGVLFVSGLENNSISIKALHEHRRHDVSGAGSIFFATFAALQTGKADVKTSLIGATAAAQASILNPLIPYPSIDDIIDVIKHNPDWNLPV